MKVLHDVTFTAGLHCDKHFFFTITIYVGHFEITCQNIFCLIYYDQKHSTEFNSFKMKIFTNICRVILCLHFS